ADKNTEDGCCASTHLDLKKIEDKQLASEQIKLKLAPVVAVALLPQVPFYKYLKGASERSFVARVWQVASAPPRLPACRQALFCTFRV
ncbi:MAG: hypothetical protein IT256_00030, partial [Chitinophagaceae bacterium]|nr:hypothetical protein [Chitinophagaceae bacterium]